MGRWIEWHKDGDHVFTREVLDGGRVWRGTYDANALICRILVIEHQNLGEPGLGQSTCLERKALKALTGVVFGHSAKLFSDLSAGDLFVHMDRLALEVHELQNVRAGTTRIVWPDSRVGNRSVSRCIPRNSYDFSPVDRKVVTLARAVARGFSR